ncbi:MAG: TIGR02186 family protein [Parvibaculales bacterium]
MSRFLAFLMLFCLYAGWLQAAQLISDLSTNEVAIETDFTGENILLFGAIEKNRDAQQDIIVIIKGPPQALTVRRKEQRFGIWINGEQRHFASAPSYYAIASTRRLDRITIPAELERHAAGLSFLPVTFSDTTDAPEDSPEFVAGLIRNKLAAGLYNENAQGVTLIDGRLFRAEIALPPGIPVGVYEARILLFENGILTGQQINRINVGIGGLEQLLHSWAFDRPGLYGVIGVIVSIVCGWGTAVAFRRRA